MFRTLLRAALLVVVAVAGPSVETATAQEGAPPQRLKLFLDCFRCDDNYIRTEITWVDYMRDRQDADLHVLVTQQRTGSGGEQYVLTFIGLGEFANRVDTLTYTASSDDTEDIRRRGLTNTLAMGLVRYVADTPLASRIRVLVDEEQPDPEAGPAATEDPWDYWVFEIGAGGEYEAESRESDRGFDLEIDINRTTAAWKFNFGVEGDYSESEFELDDATTFTSIRRSFEANLLLVKSISEHMSVGIESDAESSTFGNVEAAYTFGPAVEFNVFPYSENTRRTLTALYSVGLHSADYREVTIFDETSETRPVHTLFLGYSARQPWGSASVNVNLSQYLHDTRKNSVSFGGNINVRLFRGFGFDVRASYSKVKDQLSIPKEDATPEEILLRLQELQTDFRYSMDVGLNYRFGSSFNNVVNPRFRRGFGGFGGGGGGH